MFDNVYTIRSVRSGYLLAHKSAFQVVSDNRFVDINWSDVLVALPKPATTKFSTVHSIGLMNVEVARSASQAYQLGYALAEFESGRWSCEQLGHGIYRLTNSSGENIIVSNGVPTVVSGTYRATNPETGETETRRVKTGVYLPSVKGDYPGASEWPITKAVRRHVLRELKGRPATIWTWYHILARLLCGEDVILVEFNGSDRKRTRRNIIDGYRRQLWKLAGFNMDEMPMPADRLVWRDGQPMLVRWQRGERVEIPVEVKEEVKELNAL